MRYIFYVDVYFIQNFMMKMSALYLAMYCNKIHEKISDAKGIGKICFAAFIGTFVEILGLLSIGHYNLFVILVHFFEVPLMAWFVIGRKGNRHFQVVITGYFFTMVINGILEVLWNQFGERGSYLFYLIFSCGAVIAGVRIWRRYTKIQKGIFSVHLLFHGKEVQIKGFYDSGNRLKDPYTGRGVHIVSKQLLDRLGCESVSAVYVPFQALGNETDILEVYYIEELCIDGEKGRIRIQNCPVGVTKDKLFEEKNYEIILNEEVF